MEGSPLFLFYFPNSAKPLKILSDSLLKLASQSQENYPQDSAAVAGNRKYDVYMGIDVFGRNTFGGGQWTVCVLCFHLIQMVHSYTNKILVALPNYYSKLNL
jgi:hypothetical protein